MKQVLSGFVSVFLSDMTKMRASQVALMVKSLDANTGDVRDASLIPGWRTWQPAPVFLPGESHGQRRNLVGYSPWGHKE